MDAATTGASAPVATPQQCPVRGQGLPNQKVILSRIAAFEAEADVRVIFAAESSSRTIGTAHEQSDHDIVAIYVHHRDRYFSMQKMPTAVKKEYPEEDGGRVPEVELVAWEARHAFGLLADSTLALLDAFYSPLIYVAEDVPNVGGNVAAHLGRGDDGGGDKPLPATAATPALELPEWVRVVQAAIERRFCHVTLSWAAWGQASTNFHEYVLRKPANGVRVKKYMHVVRRVLLHQWLQLRDRWTAVTDPAAGSGRRHWPPPSDVRELLVAVEALRGDVERAVGKLGGNGGGGARGGDAAADAAKATPRRVPAEVTKVIADRLDPAVRWQLGTRGPKIDMLDNWITGELARIRILLPKRRQTLDRDPAWDNILVRVVRGATESF